MPIRKPWTSFDPSQLRRLPAALGVYELGDEEGNVIYIGCAGGRDAFGLRGRIAHHFDPAQESNPVIQERARLYRYEVNSSYMTRWSELLTLYREEHGRLPEGNEAAPGELPPLGRFHWTRQV